MFLKSLKYDSTRNFHHQINSIVMSDRVNFNKQKRTNPSEEITLVQPNKATKPTPCRIELLHWRVAFFIIQILKS